MQISPYLMLQGRGEEAIEFYKKAVGASVSLLLRMKDAPPGVCKLGDENKVMHATLNVGGSQLMLSDGMNNGQLEFKGISLSLAANSEAHAEQLYAALLDGGSVQMAMDKTFFAKKFGVVADKFGVSWMVMAE